MLRTDRPYPSFVATKPKLPRPKLHFVIALACSLWAVVPGVTVTDYSNFDGVAIPAWAPETLIVYREFLLDSTLYCLTVNAYSLTTTMVPAESLDIRVLPRDSIRSMFGQTPYVRALYDAERNDSVIQDAGITHFPFMKKGINLTIDLCPSVKPLDRDLFVQLIKAFGTVGTSVPVGISVSGLWMNGHPTDLEWLQKQEQEGRIAITWINHSYHHRTARDVPVRKNFLLEKGTDLAEEVLQTEVVMLRHGITPSVFFRFPGLVSDVTLVKRITAFGLIPVGTDAWLAKNQKPTEGSIVLIHGNGNEPIGITLFLRLLKRNRNKIVNRQWQLYDLRGCVIEQEE